MALPFLVGLIQKDGWPSWVNALIFAAACAVAAAITEWVRNGSSWGATGYFHTFIVIVLAAITLFHTYYKQGTSGPSLLAKAREFPKKPKS